MLSSKAPFLFALRLAARKLHVLQSVNEGADEDAA